MEVLNDFEIIKNNSELSILDSKENNDLLDNFLSAKQVEGCSERTINYYKSTIFKMLDEVKLKIEDITTDDLRKYLAFYKNKNNASKATIDNIRRSFQVFAVGLKMRIIFLKILFAGFIRLKPKRLLKKFFRMRVLKF
ncbi:site-specific integrase [Methanobrevibacter sp.]